VSRPLSLLRRSGPSGPLEHLGPGWGMVARPAARPGLRGGPPRPGRGHRRAGRGPQAALDGAAGYRRRLTAGTGGVDRHGRATDRRRRTPDHRSPIPARPATPGTNRVRMGRWRVAVWVQPSRARRPGDRPSRGRIDSPITVRPSPRPLTSNNGQGPPLCTEGGRSPPTIRDDPQDRSGQSRRTAMLSCWLTVGLIY
jgi:hypothetical protein